MKPVVEETYIKRVPPVKKPERPKKQSEEPRTEAVGKPVPAPSPSRPVAPAAPSKKPAGDAKAPPPPPSAAAPAIEPVKRDPHVSAIKGPKTMPALPARNVEQQVTFEAAPETPETIMERHRKEAQAKRAGEPTLTPVVPAPNPNVQPAEFDRGGQDVLKKIIPFQPGQISLPSADADPIVAGVVKELDREEMKDWRVQIKAYATPHGTGLSSDRRIALSRALSLRSTMIAQGVPASKIDVLAEGLQSEGASPPDRIDLYLYGPKDKQQP
jgi:outer membrane protein OmpA-like peptidoglycan-associated protein